MTAAASVASRVNRRVFLKTSAAAGGGLLVALYLPEASDALLAQEPGKGVPIVLCLANCYAGRFYLLYKSELSLTFGTHLVAGKRSDRGSALRLENSERFLGSSAEVDRILQPGRVSDQSGGHRRQVQGSTVRLPANRAEICDWSRHGRMRRSSFQ
jgi:hypothetical protein